MYQAYIDVFPNINFCHFKIENTLSTFDFNLTNGRKYNLIFYKIKTVILSVFVCIFKLML